MGPKAVAYQLLHLLKLCAVDSLIFAGRIRYFYPLIKSFSLTGVLKLSGLSGKFPDNLDSLESFQTVWKVSRQSGKFPDSLESFQTVWQVFSQPGKFPDSLESFQTFCKVSRHSGKFSVSLQSFQTVWKVSVQSGKFLGSLESCQTVWKNLHFLFYYVLLVIHIIIFCESNLRSLGICREKQLTHFRFMSQN